MKKFGFPECVKLDLEIADVIIKRQGTSLLIKAMVDHCKETAEKFKMNQEDKENLTRSLTDELYAELIKALKLKGR